MSQLHGNNRATLRGLVTAYLRWGAGVTAAANKLWLCSARDFLQRFLAETQLLGSLRLVHPASLHSPKVFKATLPEVSRMRGRYNHRQANFTSVNSIREARTGHSTGLHRARNGR